MPLHIADGRAAGKRRCAGRAIAALIGLAGLWLAAGLAAREVPVTILHTADLHGRVATDRPEGGGLLRCAAAIRSARSRDARALLVDVGDLFQGSAESFLSEGRVVAECVRALGYDALVPGNHEFDAGLDFLRRFYDQAGTPVLAADLRNADGGFDIEVVAADRHGVRDSIMDRMQRHGGTAVVISNPERGTEVRLRMPGTGSGPKEDR